MERSATGFDDVRKIDKGQRALPIVSTLLVALMVVILFWFFTGGSFRLYASIFFGWYFLTKQIWLSVILIGITQSLIFLPLRWVGNFFWDSIRDFEDKLAEIKSSDEQYLVFSKKVREGNIAVIFYIFNFVVNAIAFFSAGRIFLIDFYNYPLDPGYLYDFIPYPKYPLMGTDFHFPFFEVTSTVSLGWGRFLMFWGVILAIMIIPRLLWRLVRFIFSSNKEILKFRIGANRLMYAFWGFAGTLFLISLYLFFNFPTSFKYVTLVVDLTRQNTGFNFVTALATFITTLHAGYNNHSQAAKDATAAGIPKKIIDAVFKEKMRDSFRNALFLGGGAFFVTNQIPSAFELSVATFELIYIISPYTFDKIIPKKPIKKVEVAEEAEKIEVAEATKD